MPIRINLSSRDCDTDADSAAIWASFRAHVYGHVGYTIGRLPFVDQHIAHVATRVGRQAALSLGPRSSVRAIDHAIESAIRETVGMFINDREYYTQLALFRERVRMRAEDRNLERREFLAMFAEDSVMLM